MHVLIQPHAHTQTQPLRELPQGIGWKWKLREGDVRRKKNRGRRKAHVAEGDSHLYWNQLIPPSLSLSFSHPPSLHCHSFLSQIFLPVPLPSTSSHRVFCLPFLLPSFLIYLFFAPSFTFLPMPSTPLSSFSSLCCSVFSLISPSAFTRSYYHALCIPPPSSSLCHSGRAAGRQRQHTLMLLYLTRHTHTRTHVHSPATCTATHTYRKEKRGRWEYRDTHTHSLTKAHRKDNPQVYMHG